MDHEALTLSSARDIKLTHLFLITTLQSLYCTHFTDETAKAQSG